MLTLVPLASVDPAAVEALLDRAFGCDRHERTAYRIRAGATPIAGLSFAAVEDGKLLGSIQCWPVALTGDDGAIVPMVMVGPVAVDPAHQRDGIGRRLTAHALAAADSSDSADALMLIGDAGYYGRFFGFSADRTAGWRVPGPVERPRLLARGKDVPDRTGTIGALFMAPA